MARPQDRCRVGFRDRNIGRAPFQTRQQGATAQTFGFGAQIRASPYFEATVRWEATGFSVYNHMYVPRDFGNPEQNFWNLINGAILCDVAAGREVEITGPDAARFVQMLTPRDLSTVAVGECRYVLISNAEGRILNDPIREPDVSPLQLQGPKSGEVMRALFGCAGWILTASP